MKRPIKIFHDNLMNLQSFIFLVEFVILDSEVDFEMLGRPFVSTGRGLVDMVKGQMKFRLNNRETMFNIFM